MKFILNIVIILTLFIINTLSTPSRVYSKMCPDTCLNIGSCPGTQNCIQSGPGGTNCFCQDAGTGGGGTTCVPDPNNPFGCVDNPIDSGSLGPGAGLIVLFNNVLRLIFVFAGIFVFLKVLTSGLKFIGAGGDTKKIESAWNSIWQALLGLIIVISSFAIAALVGAIIFGDPMAILNPKIYGPNP